MKNNVKSDTTTAVGFIILGAALMYVFAPMFLTAWQPDFTYKQDYWITVGLFCGGVGLLILPEHKIKELFSKMIERIIR